MNVTVDALVQLRVGGLPVGTEQALSTPAALEWADLVLNGRREVTRRRREASDRLASLIEGASRQWRKELVQIRRAVFNGRPTARGVAALPAGLAAEARAAVLPAEQAGGRLTALVDRGRQEFDGWLVSQRQGLASLLDDQDFKDGLAVAAPMAMRDLMRYPQHGVCPRPSKSMRKAERSLVSYASRAIAKTSPFSTFTPTALATFKGTGPSWSLLPVRPTRRTRWNVYPVARALGALAEDRSWLHDLPLRLARTIAVLPDGSLLVARSVYEFKDSHRAEDYATCEQSTVRLRHVGLVRAVEALLVDGPRPFAEVVQGVAGTTALAEERAEDAVLGLVRLGVLEVDGLDLHPHTAAWAGRSRDVLIRTNDTRASQLVTMLDDYEGAARRIAGLEGDARLQGLQELPAKVAAIYRTASLEASLPRTVVYEDCALDAGPYTGPALRWSEEECRALVRLACLLDTAQTDRALMRGYFTETVGEGRRCDDVAGFLRSFNSDLYDAYKSRPGDPDTPAAAEGANDPWLRWGEAWRWVAARQELSALVEGAQKETDLLPLLRPGSAVTDGLRFPRQRYQHLFLFAQLLPEGDVGSMVVNRVFGQAGFGLSRFSYLHGEQGARVARDQEARAREHGVVLAEISARPLRTSTSTVPCSTRRSSCQATPAAPRRHAGWRSRSSPSRTVLRKDGWCSLTRPAGRFSQPTSATSSSRRRRGSHSSCPSSPRPGTSAPLLSPGCLRARTSGSFPGCGSARWCSVVTPPKWDTTSCLTPTRLPPRGISPGSSGGGPWTFRNSAMSPSPTTPRREAASPVSSTSPASSAS